MKRNLVILAIVVAIVGTVGLRRELRARSAADAGALPELLDLSPADSTFVAYADVAALRQAPLVQQATALAKSPKTDRDYAEFVNATGFDYERDLDRVALATRPGAPGTETVVFAEGRFDQKKIADYALRSGKIETQNGRTVYVLPSATPGKNVSFTFLSANRIAVSDGGSFFAGRGALSPASLDPALRERLSRVAGAPLFFAAKTPAGGPAETAVAPGAASLFGSIRWLEFAMRPDGSQLIISAEGECGTPEEAQKVATALGFLRGVLQSALANPKALVNTPPASAAAAAQLLKAASVTTAEDRVRLLITVTPDMLATSSQGAPASPAAPARPAGR